ncbi:MAG: helix-turn-helix transcriptional regulator [Streptomycetaceae bacterium]|nr:helix-turn-helix transcriptional regulator [Streptomycetaceae bacterium]
MTETLGARIRRLRLARGLTQRELATPIFTRAFLAAVESGVRVPGDASLRKIAERLGVDVEDLRAGRPPGLADELRRRLR